MNLEVSDALHTLSAREQKIIALRFGFDGPEHTLQEVGDKLKLSRERIRAIQCRAMRKLAHPARGLRPLLAELAT